MTHILSRAWRQHANLLDRVWQAFRAGEIGEKAEKLREELKAVFLGAPTDVRRGLGDMLFFQALKEGEAFAEFVFGENSEVALLIEDIMDVLVMGGLTPPAWFDEDSRQRMLLEFANRYERRKKEGDLLYLARVRARKFEGRPDEEPGTRFRAFDFQWHLFGAPATTIQPAAASAAVPASSTPDPTRDTLVLTRGNGGDHEPEDPELTMKRGEFEQMSVQEAELTREIDEIQETITKKGEAAKDAGKEVGSQLRTEIRDVLQPRLTEKDCERIRVRDRKAQLNREIQLILNRLVLGPQYSEEDSEEQQREKILQHRVAILYQAEVVLRLAGTPKALDLIRRSNEINADEESHITTPQLIQVGELVRQCLSEKEDGNVYLLWEADKVDDAMLFSVAELEGSGAAKKLRASVAGLFARGGNVVAKAAGVVAASLGSARV